VDVVDGIIKLGDYEYTSASGTRNLLLGDQVRLAATYPAARGDAGAVYRFIGLAETRNLGTEDYTNELRWMKLTGGASTAADLYPNVGNLTDSNAKAMGGVVVMNDVRSVVEAHVVNATLTAGGFLGTVLDLAVVAAPVALSQGTRVRTAEGDVLEFLGDDEADVDLSEEDFADAERWTRIETITVSALQAAELVSDIESNVTASGGSAYGTGSVLAVNGQIATNLVLSSADAFVEDSAVTTLAGDMEVRAVNDSALDATLNSALSSGETGIGLTLAFNTMGWRSQNVLFNTIDALLGDPLVSGAFGNEQPARANAYLLDTTVDIAGDLSVTADNAAQLNATMSNAAETAAGALFGAKGRSVGGALVNNRVSSSATASIDFTTGKGDVTVGGALTVAATDQAGLYANSKLISSTTSSNDGGAAVAQETLNDQLPADFSSDEGERALEFGDLVRLTDDYGASDFASGDGEVDIATGQRVALDAEYAVATLASDAGRRVVVPGDYIELSTPELTTGSGNQSLSAGTTVLVADGFPAVRGEAGAAYRYIGEDGTFLLNIQNYTDATRWQKLGTAGAIYKYLGERPALLDLDSQDYTDAARWVAVAGTPEAVYEYLGSDDTLDLGVQDYTDTTLWREIAGSGGAIYQYMGTAATRNLTSENYGDLGLWKQLPITSLIPQGNNISPSDATAVGGLIVTNELRSAVNASISDAAVDAASVDVLADELAVMLAINDSSVSASGGSAFGEGTVVAVNATIAANFMMSAATAVVTDSALTVAGDVTVSGNNLSQMDAITASATSSGDTAVGITLAFNTLGWEPQNVLFNTVDALIGDPLISSAFGNDRRPRGRRRPSSTRPSWPAARSPSRPTTRPRSTRSSRTHRLPRRSRSSTPRARPSAGCSPATW
jgi:hypothetical protein